MFNIDDVVADGLGLYFKKESIYNQLGRLPKPKPRFFNDWADQHGKDYDEVSPTFYETLEYEISCILIAESVSDFQEKRSQILSIISQPGGFTLFSATLGRGFHLRYLDSPSFRHINPVWSNGKLYCEFVLKLENNFKPTLTEFFLADKENYILTEQDQYIIVPDLQQNF